MGYVLFSGCVTGIAGDQFRGNSPVSGPDGGKEHRAAQLYGGAAQNMTCRMVPAQKSVPALPCS